MNHISIGGVQLDEIRIELNKISNELHQINENTRLHYGDITDLKFANELIDEQRKAIKILKEENEQLKHDATVLIRANQDYRRENEQLKSICQDHHDHAIDFKADCVRLEKENEQLKQFKSKVLELLDEKIKHYEHKPFSAPVGQPMSVNFDADVDRLARLSELQQLKEELKR